MKNVLSWFRARYYLLTGILMFLSFPSYEALPFRLFPVIAWFALVPLFVYVRDCGKHKAFLATFLTGLVGNLLVFSWIGYFGAKMTGGFAIILVFLIPTLSVTFTLRIVIAETLSRRFESMRFLIYPAAWIFVDTIHTLGFLAFPWLNWGYSQYPFTAFIQTASLAGILGINFIMITGSYIMSDVLYHYRKERAELVQFMRSSSMKKFVVFVLVFAGLLIWGASRIPGKTDRGNTAAGDRHLRVSVVQSCISPWDNWELNRFDYLKELQVLTTESLRSNPDFIIWSESATLEFISYGYEKGVFNSFLSQLLDYVQVCERPLLTGEIGIKENLQDFYITRYPQNNAVLIDSDGRVADTYAKINLVPFGEWFPYEKWFPAVKDLVARMGGSSFIPGDKPVIFETQGHRFGTLICYEGIFYRLCRKYRQMGAEYLVNMTNDGWHRAYSGHMQHFAASVFRAVENGIWVVRAGNTGYTAAIDPYGRVRSSIPILEKGFLIADLDFSMNTDTVNLHIGDSLAVADVVFLAALSLVLLYERRRKKGINVQN